MSGIELRQVRKLNIRQVEHPRLAALQINYRELVTAPFRKAGNGLAFPQQHVVGLAQRPERAREFGIPFPDGADFGVLTPRIGSRSVLVPIA